MAGVALAISVFSALEASAISKTIAASSGQMVNTNQELIGLGTGNLASAIVGGMPISGSLTRSFLNFDLGASTRISSLVSSSIVLVLIIFAGPMTRFVPKVALAAHLLVVSAQIISPRLITFAVRSTRADAAVFFVTFLSTLFLPLEIAIYLGVGMSLALFLHKVSAPQLVEYAFSEEGSLKEIDSPQKRSHAQISIIHVEGELFFGAADVFSNQIRRICEQQNLKVVILRMKNARNLDASGAMALDSLLDYLQQKNRYLIMSGVTPKVMRVLERSGLVEKLGRENVFLAEQSLNASTRNALKRALSIVAATASDIRIFFNPGQRVGPATEEASSWTFEI
ncbi:MAG: SulP family inorganic anion transporter, partial [Verrucomicrobiae bacterium]|nr:SulP family inorganic anion transporter [Verrucomicrobiae bacterium]